MSEMQPPTSASAQLKELIMERLNKGLGVAAKGAGQQAGTVAQAVRQSGEEMRQQGQDGQGKIADRVAQPIQRLSGSLSQADPQVSSDLKVLRPKLAQQVQQLKADAGSQLKSQTQTRTTAAADGVNAVTAGVRQVGEQLRAQGQQTPALVMDVLAERMEPVGSYLSSTDPDQLRSDVTAYRQKVQAKVSAAAATVNEKQQAATAKVARAGKTTAAGVRNKPALPIAGALSVVGLVALRRRRTKTPPPVAGDLTTMVPATSLPATSTAVLDGAEPIDLQLETVATAPGEVFAVDRSNLSRSELRDQATAAGLEVGPYMTKAELIEALEGR